MSNEHAHTHRDHDEDPRALRADAIESLLIEKGLIDPAAVDATLAYFENELGPMHGARVVARAWSDPDFKVRLLADGLAAIGELALGGPQVDHLVVVENTADTHNVVVCTLCSCYPWGLLGLPPAWYKSLAYRSRVVREPRAVLSEMDCDLPLDVDVKVWDSSSEVRYFVLPERPQGTDDLDEAALAEIVTRDQMIGVAR
ncbi:MAG: nitrile hydratase subunit alpha [Actinomycetota bacterium]